MNRRVEKSLIYIYLAVASIITVVPIVLLYVLAFSGREYGGSTSGFSATAATLGGQLSFNNFIETFNDHVWGTAIRNTMMTAAGTGGLTMLVAIPAAYSLARLKPKGGLNLAIWMLGLRLGPPVGFILPIYLLFSNPNVGLLDTTAGLVLAQTAFAAPFAIWLLTGFFKDVPSEYEEAALVDGCSRLRAFTKIFIHLTIAGIVVTTIFVIMYSWTDFLFPTMLTRSDAITMPYAVSLTRTEIGVKWGIASTLAIVDTAPLIVIVFAIQKYFVRGLTFGGVKG